MQTFNLWITLLCSEWQDKIVGYFVRNGYSVSYPEFSLLEGKIIENKKEAAYLLQLVIKHNNKSVSVEKFIRDIAFYINSIKCSYYSLILMENNGYIGTYGTNIFFENPSEETEENC